MTFFIVKKVDGKITRVNLYTLKSLTTKIGTL